jgi:ABC-type Mn2+/Zn2+ transport system ATPase subunit
MNKNDALLRFEDVTLGYGRRRILDSLNFTVAAGDYLAIIGSNGAGKTTLLRGLLGTLAPQSGEVSRAEGLHLGYVPQLHTLDEIFPLSVFDVVLMGRFGRIGAGRRAGTADIARTREAMAEAGIANLEKRLFRELSGGQKQRALIARALANDPDLLVLDEHTNDLDIATERAIMALIDRLHTERHLAVVMVSHSINVVAGHARSVGIIKQGHCEFAPSNTVLDEKYLEKIYGIPLRVVEVDGRRLVI